MPELGRSFSGSRFSFSSIIAVVVVVVLVGVLFFIPEMIQFQRGSAKVAKSTAAKTEVEQPGIFTEGKEFLAKQLGQLTKRSTSSKGSSVEVSSKAGADIPAPTALDEFSASLDTKDARASLKGKSAASKSQKRELSNQPITWDQIRSGSSKDALNGVRKRSMELLRSIPETAQGTRYALINYANGLDLVLNRGPEVMAAREALEYLTNLDRSVTSAMFNEAIDRDIYKRWTALSMGPILEKTSLGVEHDRYQMRFNPRITLTWVKIDRRPGRVIRGVDTSKIAVNISGFMIGDDIKRIEITGEDGLRRLRPNLSKSINGYRFFRQGGLDGMRTWIIRAYDKYGDVYEKSYNFSSVSNRMPVYGNTYQLPFKMVYASKDLFQPRQVDVRLDSYFKCSYNLNSGMEEESSSMYARF